ncbi:hypothetical protein L316_22644 [Escherichia coli SHECO002]|nr:hypothetical protein L316_22644 [Escherichia coli SHECO002]
MEIRGGAARPLGAQMVVREDGRYCGFVSGGCVEAAAAFEALEMMGSGCDREIRYGEGSPWFDIVLPCGGGITLTLHKLRSAQPLLAVLNRLEQRKPAGLRYDPQAQSLVCLPTQTRTGWNLNGFEVGFRPCVRLMIYGRSLEAQATASLAAATGYDSHIFDLFPASASAQIDTDTAVILLCHDLNLFFFCQCCRPREKQNPFISAHWAAIEPTRYVCKSSTSWDGPGRRQRKSGHPSGYSPKPGMRIHWPSPCWQKSPLYVSIRRRIHACPRRPDPCGRAWKALSHLRGKYHKLREKFAVAVLENHLNRLKERPTHSGCSSPCVTFSATRALAGLKRTGLLACCNKGQYARAKEQHTTHGKRTLPAKAVKHDASCR